MLISVATLSAQIVSESTSATIGVRACSQPTRSASRFPGISVTRVVTGYRLATPHAHGVARVDDQDDLGDVVRKPGFDGKREDLGIFLIHRDDDRYLFPVIIMDRPVEGRGNAPDEPCRPAHHPENSQR